MKPQRLTLALLLALLAMSCSIDKFVNRNLGENSPASKKLGGLGDTLGKHLLTGVNGQVPAFIRNLIGSLKTYADSLDPLDPLTAKIKREVDSLGRLTNGQVAAIGATVQRRVDSLRRSVKDEELKRFFIDAIDQAGHSIDRRTRPLLANLISTAVDRLNADSTRIKIAAFRDSTLNDATQRRLQQTVAKALEPTLDTLTARIRSIVHDDLPVVQKYATQFLWGLGLVLSGIIGWVWYQRRRYLRLVKLLTNQIHQIPNSSSYDELVGRIRRGAQAESLEPLLRETLADQGLNSKT